jgi:hypothetical protein
MMSSMDPRQLPGNTPLAFYRDRQHGFSLPYPEWWHGYDIPDGKLFSPAPSPEQVATFISVEARELGTPVTAADLPDLERGFLRGLRQVPGSKLEAHSRYDVGFLIGLEARQSYQGRRRWIRLLYRDALQVRLVAQGASAAEFDLWLPSFDPAMTSFQFDGGRPPLYDPAEEGARAS